jgi:ferredoxin-NADP reductase
VDQEREVVVAERHTVADGVVSLRLADPAGAPLPGWQPGAHIDLVLPGGLVRQYSLCGRPGDESWRIAVLREPAGRGGSAAVHDTVTVGSRLSVRGPRNHFRLHDARRYLFLAGGIGITPILPMLAAATEAGRDWTLYYGGRTRRSMAFTDELAVHGDRVVLVPEDEAGLLPLAGLTADAVYCCGPPGLLAAAEAHWPAGSLHLERFAATTPAAGERRPIEVECARSRRRLLVPADRSILEVAEEAGLDPASSCTEGICGSCETAVLDGEPEHLDDLLTEQERATGRTMLICVSRARTPRLVLDL